MLAPAPPGAKRQDSFLAGAALHSALINHCSKTSRSFNILQMQQFVFIESLNVKSK
jgi:hypothetical protein